MTPRENASPVVYGLVLAAGLSTRMGGQPKALRTLTNEDMLTLCAKALRQGGAERILAVTGHEHDAVAARAENIGLQTVFNPDYRQGMFSSICAGLKRVNELRQQVDKSRATAVFLLPVDASLVAARSIRALARYWQELADKDTESADRAILLPCFAGRSGHPPLIGSSHIADILRQKEHLSCSGGLRAYLASHLPHEFREEFDKGMSPVAIQVSDGMDAAQPPKHGLPCLPIHAGPCVTFVPLPDAGIMSDLDTPEDCSNAVDFLNISRERALPSPDECMAWLEGVCIGENKLRHCILVAAGAFALGLALKRAGKDIDLPLIAAGGLLHDLVRKCTLNDKKCKAHARRAMDMITARGWGETALVAGAHTVLPDSILSGLGLQMKDIQVMCRMNPKCRGGLHDEALFLPAPGASPLPDPYAGASESLLLACMTVYLSDKFFFMDHFVPMDERFDIVIERFNGDQKAIEAILHRKKIAGAVNAWFENVTGQTAEQILPHCPRQLAELDAQQMGMPRPEALWLRHLVLLLARLQA